MPPLRLHLGRATISWLLGVILLCTPVSHLLPSPLAPSSVHAAAGTPCATSGPSSGAYTIQLCLAEPLDGATLSGDVPVTASVTTMSGTSPDVDNLSFYLTKQTTSGRSTALTDFATPFTFELPTARWADGAYKLETLARMSDDFVTTGPIIYVTLNNGVITAPASRDTWEPKTPSAQPLVVAAVGDGAGGMPGAAQVGDLIDGWNPDMFLYLGDVYNAGSYSEFYNYYRPTLGRFDDITNPTMGNHETGKQLQGYFDYWDTTKHYYSYDASGWHFVSLDSTTQYGQTAPGTAQYDWLAADLARNQAECTLVYMHHPRFGLTSTNGNTHMSDIWSLLTQHNVDLVVTGHEHNYQRWQPLNGAGVLDPLGPTQFVIGTGGHELQTFGRSDSRTAKRVSFKDGALRLELGATEATYAFYDTAGFEHDSGSVPCDRSGGAPPPATSTFAAEADARVELKYPTTNFGTVTGTNTNALLRADAGSTATDSYLRFRVDGVSGTVQSAKLRLYANSGTTNGPAVYGVLDTTWSETGITWNTKPQVSSGPFDDKGSLSSGTWVEFDVTELVKGGNGIYSFALKTGSTDGIDFRSREASTSKPELVVTSDGSATATATPPATATPTPTATATATPPATATPTPTATATATPPATATPTPTATATATPPATATPTPTATATATPPATATPFSDDFELGNLSRWSSATGLVVQEAVVDTGTWAARATASGTTASYAYKDLSPGQGDLYYRIRFNLLTQDPATTLTLLRLRGGSGNGSRLVVYVASNGRLSYKNDVAALTTTTTKVVSKGTWHELQVHVRINDPLTELWYDGALVSSTTGSLGIEPITRLQLGETITAPTNPASKTYDIAFDNVAAGTQLIPPIGPSATPTPAATVSPTVEPTVSPTVEPTVSPTVEPTVSPTVEPTVSPTVEPTVSPTVEPTVSPTVEPTVSPTVEPTVSPTVEPTVSPTVEPTVSPTVEPTVSPTVEPTVSPTVEPTVTSTVTPTATLTPAPTTTLTVAAEADAEVREATPTANYGTLKQLTVDGGATDPDIASYLRFTVSEVMGSIQSATLRLFVKDTATSATNNGPEVWTTGASWTETGITWSNRPAATGNILDDTGALPQGTWVEYDVSGAVTGNGTFAFVLLADSADGVFFDSREAPNKPELVVTSAESGSSPQANLARIALSETSEPLVESSPIPEAVTTPEATTSPTVTATHGGTTATGATPGPKKTPTEASEGTTTPEATQTPILTATPDATSTPPGTSTETPTATREGTTTLELTLTPVVTPTEIPTTPYPTATVTPEATPTATPEVTPTPIAASQSKDDGADGVTPLNDATAARGDGVPSDAVVGDDPEPLDGSKPNAASEARGNATSNSETDVSEPANDREKRGGRDDGKADKRGGDSRDPVTAPDPDPLQARPDDEVGDDGQRAEVPEAGAGETAKKDRGSDNAAAAGSKEPDKGAKVDDAIRTGRRAEVGRADRETGGNAGTDVGPARGAELTAAEQDDRARGDKRGGNVPRTDDPRAGEPANDRQQRSNRGNGGRVETDGSDQRDPAASTDQRESDRGNRAVDDSQQSEERESRKGDRSGKDRDAGNLPAAVEDKERGAGAKADDATRAKRHNDARPGDLEGSRSRGPVADPARGVEPGSPEDDARVRGNTRSSDATRTDDPGPRKRSENQADTETKKNRDADEPAVVAGGMEPDEDARANDRSSAERDDEARGNLEPVSDSEPDASQMRGEESGPLQDDEQAPGDTRGSDAERDDDPGADEHTEDQADARGTEPSPGSEPEEGVDPRENSKQDDTDRTLEAMPTDEVAPVDESPAVDYPATVTGDEPVRFGTNPDDDGAVPGEDSRAGEGAEPVIQRDEDSRSTDGNENLPVDRGGASQSADDTTHRIVKTRQSPNSVDAAVVVDNDPTTSWRTEAGARPQDAYVVLDLGKPRSIGSLSWLVAPEGLSGTMRVEVSADGKRWQTQAGAGQDSSGPWQELRLKQAVQTRYVRLAFTNPDGMPRLGGLAEVEVRSSVKAKAKRDGPKEEPHRAQAGHAKTTSSHERARSGKQDTGDTDRTAATDAKKGKSAHKWGHRGRRS